MKPIFLSLLLVTTLCPQSRVIVNPFPPGSGLELIRTPSTGPGSGTVTSITTTAPLVGGTITSTGSLSCPTCVVGRSIVFAIGGPASGVALTNTSLSPTLSVPFGCTIGNPSGAKYSIALGTGDSGTLTVKFWKIAGGTAIPTVANVINTSGLSLSTGTAVQSATFSDFTTTTVAANDMMIMAVTAITGTIDSVLVVLPCGS